MKKPESSSEKQAITAAEMRALERAAMDSGRASGAELMERAGRGVADAILCWPEFAEGGRALVLCGPGNNGGDGYVVARCLADAGWEVTVAGLGTLEAMPPDAALNRRRWQEMGPVHDLADGLPPTGGIDILVDAVFGTGLVRPIEGMLVTRLQEAETLSLRSGAHRVAIDLPSGLETDTGRILGAVLPAHRTVTFHCAKKAHVIRPDLCGPLSVVDIGL
jgi:hydroxyethylthiazole kinase-like uncharacterized protein yjeF